MHRSIPSIAITRALCKHTTQLFGRRLPCITHRLSPYFLAKRFHSTSAPSSSSTPPTPTPTPTPSSSPSSSSSEQEKQQTKTQQQIEAEEDAAAEKEKRSKERAPVSWASLAALVVLGGSAVVYFRYQQDKQMNTVKIETVGTPLLGGPWKLTDDNGKPVSSTDFHGQYVLLYFGFTHCPDICPTELKKMEQALKMFEDSNPTSTITPIFITIDPKRDTPVRLRDYKNQWSPRMLWLTGSDSEVSSVAKSFRVYYSAPDVAEGSDEDYLVDHSIFFYLMDKEGKFMEFFGKSKSAEEIYARMAQLVAAESQRK